MRTDLLAERRLSTAVGREVGGQVHARQFSVPLNAPQALRTLPGLANRYAIRPVRTIEDIRRANLLAILGQMSAAALAEKTGIAPAMISQWKKGAPDSKTKKPRQLSSESCRRIERCIKKPDGWMDQQHWTPEQHSSAGAGTGALAHDMSQLVAEDEPPKIEWEFILTGAVLPARFEAAMPDDALAPRTTRGTRFTFSTTAAPTDGDVVIVETPAGRRYMRLFFALGVGEWEARTRDPAQPPLHSGRDGIKLLAAATHRAGGQG